MEFIIILVLIAALGISISWNYFLLNEARKKFGLAGRYAASARNVVRWKHSPSPDFEPGMRNIVLICNHPFSVMIGFKMNILNGFLNGWDIFGIGHSTPNGVGRHVLVISTCLGRSITEFQFFTDIPSDHVVATSSEPDQQLKPAAIYKPHPWQTLGIYS